MPPTRRESLKQNLTCRAFSRKNKKLNIIKCFVCAEDPNSKDEQCRFRGLRSFYRIESEGREEWTFDFDFLPDAPLPRVNKVYTQELDLETVDELLRDCAFVLVEELVREQKHLRLPGITYRPREVEYRVTCDICSTGLFTEAWWCRRCGREICNLCREVTPMRCVSVRCAEQHEPVVPTSRFQETELDKSVTEMQRILALTQHNLSLTHQPVHDTNAASNSLRVIGASELDPATFRRFWARRAPLVVRDVRLQGNWGPQFFQDRFNTTEATAVDCETEVVHKITLGNYFKDFAHGASSKVLKLKDFPPATHMKAALSDLNDAFLAAVPASDYTCPNGTRNLISHYHPQAISPDLGPKMYVAHATAQDDGHNGSTRLHVDVTCAVNIMLWASDLPDDVPGFALWHLFPPQTLAIVRAYIRTIVEDDEGDPIHNQTTYLTPSMLRTLQQDHGVSPVVVHQHVGEAVFIPANWAHQVSNAANAIKVACDFLSAENLLASVQVAKELRLQRLSAQYGDDVLQLNLSLWTAWSSLSELRTEILSRAALASSPTDGAGQGDTPNVMNDICGNLDNASDFLDLSADVQSAEAPSKGGGRKRRRKDAHSQDPIVGLPGDRFPCPVFECGRDSSRAGIMDHLAEYHKVRLPKATNNALRVPSECEDFMAALIEILLIRQNRRAEKGINSVQLKAF